MNIEKPSDDLIRFIPPAQYRVMMQTPAAFETEVHRLNIIAANISGIKTTDRMKRHPLAFRYFVEACDWYICEWDKEEDLFFGYAILNNDLPNSEWGYMNRAEIVNFEIPEKWLFMNLDLHCEDESIETALFHKDPEYFWKYDPTFNGKENPQ
jgi:hypothetical protein